MLGLFLFMRPHITLITAVYNKPRLLRFQFAALARQSFMDFELIVADDGSGNEVADVVNEAKRTMPYRIKHLWHADKGWRKNVMLNYGILESTTDYLVFIDGDCIPGKDFLLDHFLHREKGKVLLGRRVEHGERWANDLSLLKIQSGAFERFTIKDILDAIKGRSVRLEHGVRISHPFLRRFVEKSDSMLGCNFSTFKEHLAAVNGFDEEYDGPGLGEDSDIFYRLNLIGVTGKSMRNLAVQYHVWHPLTQVSEKNRRRFEETVKRGSHQCKYGLKTL
ncbi:MAG: glycosyltransferase [Ignavibacteriales bacterium]|nr:glycosyltransferase [Ignavibacteriales bacterium]